jgi:hypothetical protein
MGTWTGLVDLNPGMESSNIRHRRSNPSFNSKLMEKMTDSTSADDCGRIQGNTSIHADDIAVYLMVPKPGGHNPSKPNAKQTKSKRHQWEQVTHGNFLEPVVEFYGISNIQTVKTWKNQECLFQYIFNHGATKLHPRGYTIPEQQSCK